MKVYPHEPVNNQQSTKIGPKKFDWFHSKLFYVDSDKCALGNGNVKSHEIFNIYGYIDGEIIHSTELMLLNCCL